MTELVLWQAFSSLQCDSLSGFQDTSVRLPLEQIFLGKLHQLSVIIITKSIILERVVALEAIRVFAEPSQNRILNLQKQSG